MVQIDVTKFQPPGLFGADANTASIADRAQEQFAKKSATCAGVGRAATEDPLVPQRPDGVAPVVLGFARADAAFDGPVGPVADVVGGSGDPALFEGLNGDAHDRSFQPCALFWPALAGLEAVAIQ